MRFEVQVSTVDEARPFIVAEPASMAHPTVSRHTTYASADRRCRRLQRLAGRL